MLVKVSQEVTIIQRAGSDLACRCDDEGSGFALEVLQAMPAAAALIVTVVGRVAVGAVGGVLRVGATALVLTAQTLLVLAPAFDSVGRSAIHLALTKGEES